MRSEQLSLPVKAKARLCCASHHDPDLTTGQLRADAPAVTHTREHLFFVFAARMNWTTVRADIRPAFMQGEAQPREQEPPRSVMHRDCNPFKYSASPRASSVSPPRRDGGGPP